MGDEPKTHEQDDWSPAEGPAAQQPVPDDPWAGFPLTESSYRGSGTDDTERR